MLTGDDDDDIHGR